MFAKEIFSLEKKILVEIIKQKVFNNSMYEKSYIRGSLSKKERTVLLDNNSLISNVKKNRRLKKNNVLEVEDGDTPLPSVEIDNLEINKKVNLKQKGFSMHTTISLYRNRKNTVLRFNLPSYNTSINSNPSILDSFITNFQRIRDTRRIQETSLMFLIACKGGFHCFSSGFIGFMPKTQLKEIISDWKKDFEISSCYLNINYLKQHVRFEKFQVAVSPPLQFCFFLEKMHVAVYLKRNRFILSRKKKASKIKSSIISFIFYSIENHVHFELSNCAYEPRSFKRVRISPDIYMTKKAFKNKTLRK